MKLGAMRRREVRDELGTLTAAGTLCGDAPTVQLDQSSDEGEPQPETAV
jgi:hypothetical protein